MIDRADETPEAWGDRPSGWDGAAASGTSGAHAGTSGWPSLRAWAVLIALRALVMFVNVATLLDDSRRRHARLPLALPLTLEATSAVASLIAALLVVLALRIAPPGRGPLWRTFAVHAVGTVAFSAAHVGLMTLFRMGLFAAAGRVYPWSPSELPYEYRKDVLTYVVIAGVLWLLSRPREISAPPATPATFDIRDGASILRVPVGEILAARGAGNYVEFALEDGRRPLMRASLAAIETELAPRGFLRTHRSWLVNAARVRTLTAAGSGDFRLDLGCSLTAPLSRRYPEALAKLRGERTSLP